jgi:hypothetical protein
MDVTRTVRPMALHDMSKLKRALTSHIRCSFGRRIGRGPRALDDMMPS